MSLHFVRSCNSLCVRCFFHSNISVSFLLWFHCVPVDICVLFTIQIFCYMGCNSHEDLTIMISAILSHSKRFVRVSSERSWFQERSIPVRESSCIVCHGLGIRSAQSFVFSLCIQCRYINMKIIPFCSGWHFFQSSLFDQRGSAMWWNFTIRTPSAPVGTISIFGHAGIHSVLILPRHSSEWEKLKTSFRQQSRLFTRLSVNRDQLNIYCLIRDQFQSLEKNVSKTSKINSRWIEIFPCFLSKMKRNLKKDKQEYSQYCCVHQGLSFDPSDPADIFASRSRRIFSMCNTNFGKKWRLWGQSSLLLSASESPEFLGVLEHFGHSGSYRFPCIYIQIFLSSLPTRFLVELFWQEVDIIFELHFHTTEALGANGGRHQQFLPFCWSHYFEFRRRVRFDNKTKANKLFGRTCCTGKRWHCFHWLKVGVSKTPTRSYFSLCVQQKLLIVACGNCGCSAHFVRFRK